MRGLVNVGTQVDHEEAIFRDFLEAAPDFNGERVTFVRGPDPPDFLGTWESGKRIGVELAEWLHEKQTARARAYATLEKEARSRIIWQHANRFNVLLFPIAGDNVYPTKTVFPKVIVERSRMLDQFDPSSRLTDPNGWWLPCEAFPVLGRYVIGVRISPSGRIPQAIKVTREGSYHENDAFNAARVVLTKKLDDKRQQYADLKVQLNLDALHLILYYNRALLWNTPTEGVDGGIEVVVERTKEWLGGNRGSFDQVFVFLAHEPGKQVFAL